MDLRSLKSSLKDAYLLVHKGKNLLKSIKAIQKFLIYTKDMKTNDILWF